MWHRKGGIGGIGVFSRFGIPKCEQLGIPRCEQLGIPRCENRLWSWLCSFTGGFS